MAVELFGTAYLGLQSDPGFIALVSAGFAEFGTSNPISRLADHDFGALHAVEAVVAEAFGQEDACLFSSGYLAGIAMGLQLRDIAVRQGVALLVAGDGHPSAHCGLSMRTGLSMSDAEAAQRHAATGWLAVFDSINSLLGQVTSDPLVSQVIRGAVLRAVDVSHTAFLWSDHHELLHQAPTLFFGSLGKAAAFPAGFIAGPSEIIAALRDTPIYSASSPPAMVFADAFLKAASLRRARIERLRQHLGRIDHAFGMSRGNRWFPAYRLADDEALCAACTAAGFKLSRLNYPTPTSESILRAVIKAGLGAAEVDAFLGLCQSHRVKPLQDAPASTWQAALCSPGLMECVA